LLCTQNFFHQFSDFSWAQRFDCTTRRNEMLFSTEGERDFVCVFLFERRREKFCLRFTLLRSLEYFLCAGADEGKDGEWMVGLMWSCAPFGEWGRCTVGKIVVDFLDG
jgi:hypothetical protein